MNITKLTLALSLGVIFVAVDARFYARQEALSKSDLASVAAALPADGDAEPLGGTLDGDSFHGHLRNNRELGKDKEVFSAESAATLAEAMSNGKGKDENASLGAKELTALYNQMRDSLGQEIVDRTAADQSLSDRIDETGASLGQEIVDRTAADQSLSDRIDETGASLGQEIVDRTAADQSLSDRIDDNRAGLDQEIAIRMSAVESLSSRIDQTATISALNNAISDLEGRMTDLIDNLRDQTIDTDNGTPDCQELIECMNQRIDGPTSGSCRGPTADGHFSTKNVNTLKECWECCNSPENNPPDGGPGGQGGYKTVEFVVFRHSGSGLGHCACGTTTPYSGNSWIPYSTCDGDSVSKGLPDALEGTCPTLKFECKDKKVIGIPDYEKTYDPWNKKDPRCVDICVEQYGSDLAYAQEEDDKTGWYFTSKCTCFTKTNPVMICDDDGDYTMISHRLYAGIGSSPSICSGDPEAFVESICSNTDGCPSFPPW